MDEVSSMVVPYDGSGLPLPTLSITYFDIISGVISPIWYVCGQILVNTLISVILSSFSLTASSGVARNQHRGREGHGARGGNFFPRGAPLTRAPLGYSAERAPLGGADSAPPLPNSRTDGRRKTGKTAIESSQQDES